MNVIRPDSGAAVNGDPEAGDGRAAIVVDAPAPTPPGEVTAPEACGDGFAPARPPRNQRSRTCENHLAAEKSR